MRAFVSLLCVAVSAAVVAASGSTARVVLEAGAWNGAPPEWTMADPVPGDELVSLSVAVKQRNVDLLEEELMAVSSPTSARYGQHYTLQAVHDLIAPAPESLAAVLQWLHGAGVTDGQIARSLSGDMLTVTVPTALANALLGATYHRYVHTNGKMINRLSGEYTVPAFVADHLDVRAAKNQI